MEIQTLKLKTKQPFLVFIFKCDIYDCFREKQWYNFPIEATKWDTEGNKEI